MQDHNHLSKLRAEQIRLRLIGIVVIIVGYSLLLGTFGVHGEAANPFLMILFLFIAVSGIILFLRSFLHIKFKPLREARAAQRANKTR